MKVAELPDVAALAATGSARRLIAVGDVNDIALYRNLVSAGAASSLPGLRSFLRSKKDEAEGRESVTPEASEPTRNIALAAFYGGKLTHEDQLLPYRAQLTKADYRFLHDTVLKGRAENAANAGDFASINETINRLAPDMKPIIGEDKDGKKAAALRGSVIYAITREEEALQKPVSEQRRREIALNLFANTALEDRDGRTAVVVPNYNKIPVAQRREIEASLRRRLTTGSSAFTRPWKAKPERSKATFSMPAALAFSAMRLPTTAATSPWGIGWL